MSDRETNAANGLIERAEQAGVATAYWTAQGDLREPPQETLEVVLGALEPSDPDPLGEQVLQATRVTRRSRLPLPLDAHLASAGAVEVRWALELETEDGGALRDYGTARLAVDGTMRIPCAWTPPVGYHRLLLVVETGNRRWTGEQLWVVAPDRCWSADEALARDRGSGVLAQLPALRSDRNWGFGDLSDVSELCRRTATLGADFVMVSPLHALLLRGGAVDPYTPSSRLFRNPLAIDIEAVPELQGCAETRAWLAAEATRRRLGRLRAADQVRYEVVLPLKMQALRRLHRQFRRERDRQSTDRHLAYAQFRREQGPLLDAFATFQTLSDLLGEAEGLTDWRTWPRAYRSPHGSAVRAFAAEHAELVDFHRFLQFEIDCQLAAAAAVARAAGLRIGLVQEVAFGSHPGGFDTWAFPELFGGGVALGNPPDQGEVGADVTGLPALVPHKLTADGYRFWIRLVRGALTHGGGVRLDHASGLVRQFWVPHGSPTSDGTFVCAPDEALLGILSLESRRAHAVVIGDDASSAPPSIGRRLVERAVPPTRLATRLRDDQGALPPVSKLARDTLLLASDHHLPPLAAWWRGEDLDLRRRCGDLDERAWTDHHAERRRDRERLLDRLRREGLVPSGPSITPHQAMTGLHTYMAQTSASLVGIWLDDAARERRPICLTGLRHEDLTPWRRRLRASMRAIFKDPAAAAALEATTRRGRPGPGTDRLGT